MIQNHIPGKSCDLNDANEDEKEKYACCVRLKHSVFFLRILKWKKYVLLNKSLLPSPAAENMFNLVYPLLNLISEKILFVENKKRFSATA